MNPGLVHELTKLLGEDSVLHKLEDLLLYEYDGSVEKGLPDVVVFPTTTGQVSQCVKLAAKSSSCRRRGGVHGPFRRRARPHRRTNAGFARMNASWGSIPKISALSCNPVSSTMNSPRC
jgi:hypothetical protein